MRKLSAMALMMSFCVLVLGALPACAQVDLINEDFDSVTVPALPTGWTVDDTNTDTYTWESYGSYACSGTQDASIRWNAAMAMDDWLFTPVLALDSTHNYSLAFKYRVASAPYPEDLPVFIGTAASAGSQTTQIVDLPGITDTDCAASSTAFTVGTTGTYYIGFHGHSAADMFRLVVDDVVVTDESVPVELQSFNIE